MRLMTTVSIQLIWTIGESDMNIYTVFFTDGRRGFTVEIEGLTKADAENTFKEFYPAMYIEETEFERKSNEKEI